MSKNSSSKTEPNWTRIGRVEDITRLGSRIIKRAEGNIALFRTQDDQVYAIADKCPHKGGPLSQGIVHDCFVTCPLHNWVLNLKTGLAAAPDEGHVPTYPVRVDNGVIFLDLAKAAGSSAAREEKQCA